jgi:hypothetical protein
MKTVLGVVTGVFLGCIIVFAGLSVLLFWGPFRTGQASPSLAVAAPSTLPTLLVSALPAVSPSAPYTPPAAPEPAALPPAATVPLKSPPAAVKPVVLFDLSITAVSGSGFSRLVFARITNLGTADAHHASIKVEAFYQGSRVKIGGKDYFLQDLGTLKAGAFQAVQADLSFPITDISRINKNGVDFVVTLGSDEHRQSLQYHYQP